MVEKFNAFKESIIVAFKHFLKDNAESVFKMDKDDMSMATDFIDVYNKSMDYTEAMSKQLDDMNTKIIRLGWRLDEIESTLEKIAEKEEQ